MNPTLMRTRWALLILTLLIILVVVHFPAPARACSCAAPFDLVEAIDASEAAFVGTLIDKQDVGDYEAVYVFEVEEWVKSDLGDVVEIRSARDGGGCGFEVPFDGRTGAFVHREGTYLAGGLCTQVDPDALLAAAEAASDRPTVGSTTPPLATPPEENATSAARISLLILAVSALGMAVVSGWRRRSGQSHKVE